MSTTVGLVGVGSWGAKLLAQFTRLGVEVVCYPGRTAASRERLRDQGDYRTAERIDDLFSDPAIDAIAIATPVETHAALAQESLRSGKHTFVEKPLCLEMADVDHILGLARERRCVLFTGYTVSCHPVVRELERICATGQLRSMWSYKSKMGSFTSDVVSTLLVHDLAVADRLGRGLQAWTALEVSGPDRGPDAVTLGFTSAAGAQGLMRVDRASPHDRRELRVCVDDRLFRWDGGHDLVENVQGEFQAVYSSALSALEVELGEFLSAVATGSRDSEAWDQERRLAELAVSVRQRVLA